jgi:hypothetical protein
MSKVNDEIQKTSKFNFPSLPICIDDNSSAEAGNVANLFVLRVLEVMHNLGYEFVLSSDLSSIHGQSSLFFRRASQVEKLAKHYIVPSEL